MMQINTQCQASSMQRMAYAYYADHWQNRCSLQGSVIAILAQLAPHKLSSSNRGTVNHARR